MLTLTELSALKNLAREDRVRRHDEYMKAIGHSTVDGVGLDPRYKEEYDFSVLLVNRVSEEHARRLRERAEVAAA